MHNILLKMGEFIMEIVLSIIIGIVIAIVVVYLIWKQPIRISYSVNRYALVITNLSV